MLNANQKGNFEHVKFSVYRHNLSQNLQGFLPSHTQFIVQARNFGDHKYLRDSVSELRIHVGAGYRVYYSISGDEIILLLCGGSKNTQEKDIDKAVGFLEKFKER